MGLSSDEFYDLTPRQLEALMQRREVELRQTEFLHAQHTACTVNSSMAPPKKPLTAADFMPSEWGRKKKPVHTRMRNRKVIAKELEEVMESAMRYQETQLRLSNGR